MALIYIEHLLILTSAVTGCVSFSAFVPLVGPIGIASSVVGFKIFMIASGIKKSKSVLNKKKKKEHDKISLLAKTKLNIIEVLISRALAYSCISYMKLFQ